MAEVKKSVMVGMSGGVDSTVTALLLQQQGYEVVGVTFRLWTPDVEDDLPERSCCSINDVRDAKMVCAELGIPHYVFNYKDMFKERVIQPFAEEYSQGRTPNPCIACNREIKFSHFLKRARGMGYDYIATGHYAKIEKHNDRYRLKMADSIAKDQSYVLYGFTQDQLEHTLMPLGDYDKSQVREMANNHGFAAGEKPDSQDICFVPDGDYVGFLEKYTNIKSTTGDFLDIEGNIIGQHLGIHNYTIGQRKGLGTSFGKPMFVKEIDSANNIVILGEDKDLYSKEFIAIDLNWIDFEVLDKPLEISAKIRYAAKPSLAVVEPHASGCRVIFKEPERAITPGQAVVFYNDAYVVGGGTIDKVL